jgi:hypothetical protein
MVLLTGRRRQGGGDAVGEGIVTTAPYLTSLQAVAVAFDCDISEAADLHPRHSFINLHRAVVLCRAIDRAAASGFGPISKIFALEKQAILKELSRTIDGIVNNRGPLPHGYHLGAILDAGNLYSIIQDAAIKRLTAHFKTVGIGSWQEGGTGQQSAEFFVTEILSRKEFYEIFERVSGQIDDNSERLLSALQEGNLCAFAKRGGNLSPESVPSLDFVYSVRDEFTPLHEQDALTIFPAPPGWIDLCFKRGDVEAIVQSWFAAVTETNDIPKEVEDIDSEPKKPKAQMPALLAWANDLWPAGDLPGRDSLLKIARRKFSGVDEKRHIRPLRKELAKNRRGGAPMHRRSLEVGK